MRLCLAAAFLALADAFPQVAFAAIPTWGTNQQDRASLEVRPNVRLLQPVDDINQLLASTRVLLVPSLWAEARSRIILEAMLRGVPVMAANVGGIPEAITDRVNGLLVDEADPEALFRALQELTRDNQLRGSIAEKGAEVVASKFNHAQQIKNLENIYLRVIEAAAHLQRDDK